MPRTRPMPAMPRIATDTQRPDRRPPYDVSSDAAQAANLRHTVDRALASYDQRLEAQAAETRRAVIYATTALVAGASAIIAFCALASTVYASPATAAVVAVSASIGFGVTWVCAPRYL